MQCVGQAVSLRQQVEALRQVCVCAPDAPCALKLEQMEKEHRERLQKIHDEHERERREMERDKQRLLQEEAKNAVQGPCGPDISVSVSNNAVSVYLRILKKTIFHSFHKNNEAVFSIDNDF